MGALEKACAQAAEGGKIVVADFCTGWCAPQTLWEDPEVLSWLQERAVFVAIDAEKEAAAAERFRVMSYPTILLLRPDGSEFDRLVGFRSPKEFLADASAALEGKDTLARAKEALGEDPRTRRDYARALAERGRAAEALEEYLLCYGEGLAGTDAGAFGLRLGVMQDIARLGRSHPPALEALRRQRDRAGQEMRQLTRAIEFAALNRVLGEEHRTLEAYDASQDPKIRAALFNPVSELLNKARRYEDFLAGTGDPLAALDARIKSVRADEESLPDDDALRGSLREGLLWKAACMFEACIGAGRYDEAHAVTETLLSFERSGRAYVHLILAARRAGIEDAAQGLGRQARHDLPPDDLALVERALSESASP